MTLRKLGAALALIILSSQNSFGGMVSVNFNSQTSGFTTSVSEGGFVFTNADPENGFSMAVLTSDQMGPPGPANGTPFLISHDSNSVLSVQHSGGAVFSLLSFDLAEGHANLPSIWADNVVLTGYLSGGGTVTTTLIPDFVQDGPGGASDWQSILLPGTFTNLTKVDFAGIGPNLNFYSLDNLVFDISETPEPTSLALLGVGSCAFGFAARRRRHKDAIASVS